MWPGAGTQPHRGFSLHPVQAIPLHFSIASRQKGGYCIAFLAQHKALASICNSSHILWSTDRVVNVNTVVPECRQKWLFEATWQHTIHLFFLVVLFNLFLNIFQPTWKRHIMAVILLSAQTNLHTTFRLVM